MRGRVWVGGRLSEAVKVMGRLCQLAEGWGDCTHSSSLCSAGGRGCGPVSTPGCMEGNVTLPQCPLDSCFLPLLPRPKGKKTEPARPPPPAELGWGCLYRYTCHHVCLVHSGTEMRVEVCAHF